MNFNRPQWQSFLHGDKYSIGLLPFIMMIGWMIFLPYFSFGWIFVSTYISNLNWPMGHDDNLFTQARWHWSALYLAFHFGIPFAVWFCIKFIKFEKKEKAIGRNSTIIWRR